MLPRCPVRLDFLEDHSAQTCKYGCGYNAQHHRPRFLSHAAILVTPATPGQYRRRAFKPANLPQIGGGCSRNRTE